MAKAGKTGVTANTPKNILLGAGTIHKGLKYEGTAWNFDKTLVGATSGGNKLIIKPEILTVGADGANVRTKGLDFKTGGTASLEVNFLELTKDLIKAATFGKEGTSADSKFDLIEDKETIEDGDYWENIAFVGKTAKGEDIIAILDNALCTTGLETEGKAKEGSVGKYTFECTADITTDLDTLPWHIYYPKRTQA